MSRVAWGLGRRLSRFCRSSRPSGLITTLGRPDGSFEWLSEAERPSIDQPAELAATLADLPAEPAALERLLGLLG
jgi:hypothetical protein